jgi:hypothetical protein
MRKLLFIPFLFLSLHLVAQTKITFRDGKTYTIIGEKIGTSLDYEMDEPTKVKKKTEYFLSEQKGIYTLEIYATWQTAANLGDFDDLRIYIFTKDQFDSSPVVHEHTDDNEKIVNYSLMFSSKDETPFKYDVYTKYQSTPDRSTSFSTFSVYNDQKEPLLILAEKLKLPETETSEE